VNRFASACVSFCALPHFALLAQSDRSSIIGMVTDPARSCYARRSRSGTQPPIAPSLKAVCAMYAPAGARCICL
jgi:hypothetical protein